MVCFRVRAVEWAACTAAGVTCWGCAPALPWARACVYVDDCGWCGFCGDAHARMCHRHPSAPRGMLAPATDAAWREGCQSKEEAGAVCVSMVRMTPLISCVQYPYVKLRVQTIHTVDDDQARRLQSFPRYLRVSNTRNLPYGLFLNLLDLVYRRCTLRRTRVTRRSAFGAAAQRRSGAAKAWPRSSYTHTIWSHCSHSRCWPTYSMRTRYAQAALPAARSGATAGERGGCVTSNAR